VSTRPPPILEARNVCCLRDGSATLRDISLTIDPASFNVLIGEVGSGKNLLLRVLGLLETPELGEVFVEGRPTTPLSADARADMRNLHFGYLFAAPFLLAAFSAVENVAMPFFRISHVDPPHARVRSEELLGFVDLQTAAQVPVGELTLGQQLRVSLARSLVNRPVALFVENLDTLLDGDESHRFNALLRLTCARFSTAIVATASPHFHVEKDDRRIELVIGTVAGDSRLMGKCEA
jgi:ABC-type lipoprotein export system ATPase subunit